MFNYGRETAYEKLEYEMFSEQCAEQAKEQECEELKEIIQRHDNDNNALLKEVEDELCEYYRRYIKCLAEIKEIAEENIRIADLEGLNGVYRRGLAEQILQKISECEGNNDMENN